MLSSVFTSVPPSAYLRRAPIDPARIRWCLQPEFVGPRIPRLLHIPHSLLRKFDYWYAVCFDRRVRGLVRKEDLDLFVVFNRFGLETIRTLRKRGVPIVVERGSTHARFREALLDREYDLLGLDRSALRLSPEVLNRELEEYEQADCVVVPSCFAKDSFVHEGVKPHKVITVPYGVDTELFRPDPLPNLSKFGVLSVGNLGVEKGTHHLLTAMEKLAIPGIELVLAGALDSYLKGRLLKSKVPWKFVGHVPQSELPAWYRKAAVFCLPSIQEGMAMVVLEAMACGIPAIVSTNTGCSGVVREGKDGYVIPTRDPETLAERILKLYKDPPLRMLMGMNARERALAFTWDTYGDRVAQCYRNILKRRNSMSNACPQIGPVVKQEFELTVKSARPLSRHPAQNEKVV
jgi:glycosyltransferase involved in cell wall biosynthesis